MSEFSTVVPPPIRPASNTLGFTGFLFSVFGLVCTAGALSPVGLLLSVIALRRNPRGFALAGSIIGGVGTFLCITLMVGTFAAVALAAAISGTIKKGAPFIKSVADGASLYHQIDLYRQAHGEFPSSLEDLDIDPAALIDGWGHRFRYQLGENGSFTIISDGPDGKQGTLDDIRSTSDDISPRRLRGRRPRNAV